MVRMKDGNVSKVLMRRRDGRMLAGVCAGAAGYVGLDVTVVRVTVPAGCPSRHRRGGATG